MIFEHFRENVEHPWFGDRGYEGLDILSDSNYELLLQIGVRIQDGWNVWIVGTMDGKPGAYLYRKPATACVGTPRE